VIRRIGVTAIAVSMLLVSALCGQGPYLAVSAGRMLYDAAGDTWHPATTISVGVPVSARVRVGVLAAFSAISGFDTLVYDYASTEHVSRFSAIAEWDAAKLGATWSDRSPTLFLRAGFGVAHTSGHPPSRFKPYGTPSPLYWTTTGLSASLGSGVRVPIGGRVALLGGLDFHNDQILDSREHNWTWTTGVAIRP
jgi:hypothetical protein